MIKVFVGLAPNGEDAESAMVLEYSLRKNSSQPVEIVWMKMSRDPTSFWYAVPPVGWNTTQWATPFSGFRWGIPEYCNYEGRAIYMDSDMMILKDINNLWTMDLHGKVAAVKRTDRFCVTLWDCAEFKKITDATIGKDISQVRHMPQLHSWMGGLFQHGMKDRLHFFDSKWNCFDGENERLEDINILHYTDMSTQPHVTLARDRLAKTGQNHWFDGTVREHRRSDVVELFNRLYREALVAGYKVEDYIPKEPFGEYKKQSQVGYRSNNGFDVTQKQ